jgi:hypothetical protein
MIKRYNEFVSGKVNEYFSGLDSHPDLESQLSEPNEVENSELSEIELGEEEEEGGYQGQELLNQLANELGTEVDADGSINYKGKKVNFFSETEKFHVDNKKFSTPKEVVAYLGSTEMNSSKEDEMTDELDEKFESKSYRKTRLNKFSK